MATKLGIAIDLNALDDLVADYLVYAERDLEDDNLLLRRLMFSEFLLWVEGRQGETLVAVTGKG